ncbi:MAG: T9SS C-terminal target domain-containing protein [Bacteroidetes bacterium]|nr:MAG: T9SS C-terminal target domain-containing protein [Bacteroidota bacterium]REK07559.1 MAG: T9SS C-terminal target domain-containing protein [Bacteroidota bacterium]REK37008.1 MAG: T9SS C-terminal target domain-containing protein [Bacteroidota bacterium]REK47829.1 MAG: T9SS C-terminal target domain-containing protein [Bacteroidota bacterium]
MKRIMTLAFSLLMFCQARSQNPLFIPDTLSGTNFSLNLYDTSHVFYPGFTTRTFGVNAAYLGPTLIMQKGDSVNIEVHNMLMDTTTIHWHGMHVNPHNDGGPHVYIPPGTTWNPKFTVRDHASTFWYHPHLHMMTNLHATLGAAGMIIVRDSAESALNLPRSYGIDDFPIVIQSKAFDMAKQIVVGDAYDSVMMVNGTFDPYLNVPAQVVRLRLLNASTERVYNIGIQNNMPFSLIGSDGGLLDTPLSMTRLMIAPGERFEILLNFDGMTGSNVDLMSYASELPNAIYGAIQPGMVPGQVITGYTSNPLNGADFRLMKFQVTTPSSNPVTSVPLTLITNTPWPTGSATNTRTLVFSPVNPGPTAIQGPFYIDNTLFDMNVINQQIPLDAIETWTLSNQSPIAHPFHIHDVQFYILNINGTPTPAHLSGRKDVVLVPAMQSVTFITKFETFCDDMMPYMYHCHMLSHEDDGMMGQFLVNCPTTEINSNEKDDFFISFPNPSSGIIQIQNKSGYDLRSMIITDQNGKVLIESNPQATHTNHGHVQTIEQNHRIDLSEFSNGIYYLKLFTDKTSYVKKIIILK